MNIMVTYKIHFDGQVQGVGFRPLVYSIATAMNLKGTVCNGTDGVEILINGSLEQCLQFYQQLLDAPPKNARITNHYFKEVATRSFDEFSIKPSKNTGKFTSLLTPDIAMCDACRIEMNDRDNRRYHYPFITCLQCGPRYSIIEGLPYDRENTSMHSFQMCNVCESEFNDPADLRHYSQTNSCEECAITLSLLDAQGKVLTSNPEAVLGRTHTALAAGNIVAFKGIGGFLIMADPSNAKAVNLLRQRKHRPNKPFALLFPSVEDARKVVGINELEERALLSKQAPIVLLSIKENAETNLAFHAVAPRLDKIGVMLPYAPVLELLMTKWNKPLIATSGNMSNDPIIYSNEIAIEKLSGIADFLVVNDREIVVPQDDSVIQFAKQSGQPIFLRRSRGYAPTYLPNPLSRSNETILAMGGDLKSAFAIQSDSNLFVSQYLGDLSSYDTQVAYEHTVNHLLGIIDVVPDKIIIDQHPDYFSSAFGKKLADQYTAEVDAVQHHEAHFSAVLAENQLLESKEPVLGVIWDGTGWGQDSSIWGGEFFKYEHHDIKRVTHIDYFDHILGDKHSREPRLSAYSLCKTIPEAKKLLKPKFTDIEWDLLSRIVNEGKLIRTSSMGRLFDGVASLLGLCDKATYEGEAAMYLEALARKAVPEAAWIFEEKFSRERLIEKVVDELLFGTAAKQVAYQFHLALVNWIEQVAVENQIHRLAFSGGVFQNSLLVDLIIHNLSDSFELYFHQQLSPNDECIGFGQLAYLQIREKSRLELKYQQEEIPVLN